MQPGGGAGLLARLFAGPFPRNRMNAVATGRFAPQIFQTHHRRRFDPGAEF